MNRSLVKSDVLRHLFYSYGREPLIWVGIAFSLISYFILKIAVPIVIAKTISYYFAQELVGFHIFGIILLIYTAGIAIGSLGDVVFIRKSDERYEHLVEQLYRDAVANDTDVLRTRPIGEIMSIFRNLMDGTINIFRLFRIEILSLAVSTLVPIFILSFYSLTASAVLALGFVLRGIISWLSTKHTMPLRKAAIAAYGKLSGVVADHIAQQNVLLVSANQKINRDKIRRLASEEGRLFWERHVVSTKYDLFGNAISAVCFISVLAILFISSSDPSIRIELSIIAVLFVYQGLQASQGASELQQRFNERWAHIASSLSFFPRPVQKMELAVVPVRAKIPGAIEFDHVSFSYDEANGVNIFSDTSLTIGAGLHIALVGKNGIGKSTFVNLVMGFDFPRQGTVHVSGLRRHVTSDDEYYRSISYVPQSIKLFNQTIGENIFFFEPNCTPQRFKAVSEVLQLDKIVGELADGLETQVGEGGAKISGGQRQIIALARALLRDAPIYVFDEATSDISSDYSIDIVRAIRLYLRDRTIIFITHSSEIEALFKTRLEIIDQRLVLSGFDDASQSKFEFRDQRFDSGLER